MLSFSPKREEIGRRKHVDDQARPRRSFKADGLGGEVQPPQALPIQPLQVISNQGQTASEQPRTARQRGMMLIGI